jgi:hypothetical protein
MFGKLSDSEKRFDRQLRKAVARHDYLLSNGKVSLLPEEGRLAILHSYGTTVNSEYSAEEQKEIFKSEAERISFSEIASLYGDVEVLPLVNKFDMDFAIQDANVAGIVLVGHGTLASVRMHQDEHYDWHDAERSTRQLKLGHFVQRTCGFLKREKSVPLGTFVVADQRKVIAPPGVGIDDKYPDESLFQSIYPAEVNDAETILALRDMYHAISKHNSDVSDETPSDGILNTND